MNCKISTIPLVAALVLLSASTAFADEPAEASQAQLELNQQGVEAIIAEDYPRAIRLFEASLDLGDLNITYLNLGRAYQHDGQCEKAEEKYGIALEAPQVSAPSAEEVQQTIMRYRDELRQKCPGYLEVECDPPELSLYIDDDGPTDCVAQSRFELLPGEYDVRGEFEEDVTSASVAIEALRTSQLELGLEVVQAAEPVGTGIAELETPSTEFPDPWMWLAASGVAIVGGVILDTVPQRAKNYEMNAINFVPPGLYLVGAAAAFQGIRELRR